MGKKETGEGLDASFIISQASKRDREILPRKQEAGQNDSLATNAGELVVEETPVASPKEDNRRRKNRGQDYESLFIRDALTSTRSGKTAYIRKEFHERITRIVQVIGRNELTLFSYLDNVLEHHFNTYQEDISELYNKRNTDIFNNQ
jgi:hypothetical protein